MPNDDTVDKGAWGGGNVSKSDEVILGCSLNSVLNVKAVVAAFNQEKALVGAFSVITKLRMELFQALEVKSVCWKMLCVQYFKNFLQHGPT